MRADQPRQDLDHARRVDPAIDNRQSLLGELVSGSRSRNRPPIEVDKGLGLFRYRPRKVVVLPQLISNPGRGRPFCF